MIDKITIKDPIKDADIIDTDKLRDASRAIYIAVDEDIARDISEKLIHAADTIDILRDIINTIKNH